jgi:hypothetical protein
MGFVIQDLVDVYSEYKLWVRIADVWGLGEKGAAEFLKNFLGLLDEDLEMIVTMAKVSTDEAAVLVVYISESINAFEDDLVWYLAELMKQWAGSPQVKVGYTAVAGSEVVHVY